MYAVIETFIDQDSGERGEQCVYHNQDLSYITKAKQAFENIGREDIT